MLATFQPPTAEKVQSACTRFDHENALAEQTLEDLFRRHPNNSDPRHVLLKVLAVNSLYHTCIFALDTVARHIHAHHAEIDQALASGSPEAVTTIAKVPVHNKLHNFYSFATKFCSWHNPAAYPMYDSHIDHYLWTLQQQDRFASFLHPALWNYAKFQSIMEQFRKFHGLSNFTYQQIDKFLLLECAPAKHASAEPEPCGPGAFDYYPAEGVEA